MAANGTGTQMSAAQLFSRRLTEKAAELQASTANTQSRTGQHFIETLIKGQQQQTGYTQQAQASLDQSSQQSMSVGQWLRSAWQTTSNVYAKSRAKQEQSALRRHDHLVKQRQTVGGRGEALSRYWLEAVPGETQFEATAGWYLNEAHHDATGADPSIVSMFMLAFLARLVYSSALEAFVFAMFVALAELVVWFAVRLVWPGISRHLDSTESVWLAFVYNLVSFVSGVAVGSYCLAVWPGMTSVAASIRATCDVYDEHILWLPCTESRIFVVLAVLFVLSMFSAFASLYAYVLSALVLVMPLSVLVLRVDRHLPVATFYTLLFASLSMAYFYASFVRLLANSYVWNLLLSVTYYLFVVSILVGFGF